MMIQARPRIDLCAPLTLTHPFEFIHHIFIALHSVWLRVRGASARVAACAGIDVQAVLARTKPTQYSGPRPSAVWGGESRDYVGRA